MDFVNFSRRVLVKFITKGCRRIETVTVSKSSSSRSTCTLCGSAPGVLQFSLALFSLKTFDWSKLPSIFTYVSSLFEELNVAYPDNFSKAAFNEARLPACPKTSTILLLVSESSKLSSSSSNSNSLPIYLTKVSTTA